MKSVSKNKRKPNWLLRCLIGISIGIHLVIFMHIAGIYKSEALTYIELTMKDFSKPPSRSIPRPRLRPKTPKQPNDVKKLNVHKRVIPSLKPIKIDPVDKNLPDSLVESVGMPDIPNDTGLKITNWHADHQIGTSDYITTNDYFEMVRLRIESHKKYPSAAKTRGIEGRATIRFVISQDGQVTSLGIVKSARHGTLNRAALNAVKEASPFPRPPRNLFKGPIPLEITIMFELT